MGSIQINTPNDIMNFLCHQEFHFEYSSHRIFFEYGIPKLQYSDQVNGDLVPIIKISKLSMQKNSTIYLWKITADVSHNPIKMRSMPNTQVKQMGYAIVCLIFVQS